MTEKQEARQRQRNIKGAKSAIINCIKSLYFAVFRKYINQRVPLVLLPAIVVVMTFYCRET